MTTTPSLLKQSSSLWHAKSVITALGIQIHFWSMVGFGQDAFKIDSLSSVISNAKDDSVKIEAMVAWDELIFVRDPQLDLKINREIEALCIKHLESVNEPKMAYYSSRLSKTLNIIGTVFQERKLYEQAIASYQKALLISKHTGSMELADKLYLNIGEIYQETGKYTESMRNLRSSLDIAVLTKDMHIESRANTEMGVTMKLRGDSCRAAGNTPFCDEFYDESNRLLISALEISLENGDYPSMMETYEDLTELNSSRGSFLVAENHARNALTASVEENDSLGIANAYLLVGNLYYDQKKYHLAIESGLSGFGIAKAGRFPLEVQQNAELLYKSYRDSRQAESALKFFKLFVDTRDSLRDVENLTEELRQKFKLTYEKQLARDSVAQVHAELMKEVEISSQQAQLRTEKIWRYAIYGFLLVIAISTVYLYRGFRQKKKDTALIKQQKEEVELHRKKILSSITYAERIQKSILPEHETIRQHLPGFECIYLPRDIVSGDFYWFAHKAGISYIALADCTGHGVPGAFMSMIGSTLLKDIIVDSNIDDPAQALEQLDKEIRDLLNQNDVKDSDEGMEIALIKINLRDRILSYSSANIDIYLIRSQVQILRGDSRTIGGGMKNAEQLRAFRTQEISLDGVLKICLMSDGIEDQLHAISGEKFGHKRLVSSLDKSNGDLTSVLSEFELWKGHSEQVDDVCAISLKIEST